MKHTRREDILEKILRRVKIEYLGFEIDGHPSPCHIWQGSDSGKGKGGGYGRFCCDGVTTAVHLAVFTHFFGIIPSKKQVDHKCNNRLCCNPDHLELVTHLQNQRRRASRTKEKKHAVAKTPMVDVKLENA